jgi:hypothetical protein
MKRSQGWRKRRCRNRTAKSPRPSPQRAKNRVVEILRAAGGGKSGIVFELPEGKPVLHLGKPYLLVEGPDTYGFCTLMDVEGETIVVRETELQNSGFAALVVWKATEAQSK